jgi:hypothetical protein
MWTTEGLANESDVEQKFLYPFLTEAKPLGLGCPPSVVLTKANIRRLPIGKGADKKIYYPDYLIVTMGLPLLVVEAKAPNDSVEEGFRQARMYAAELNALFAHEIAPAKLIVASNGRELWFGYWDQAQPVRKASCESLGVYSPEVAEAIELLSWDAMRASADALAKVLGASELFKPRRLVGGAGVQNEEVGINTFGATLTTIISPIFNPTSEEERAEVARNAYVPSKRRERYVDPIDRVIRAAKPPSETHAIPMEDSSKPIEVIGRLRDQKSLEHKVLLLIGSVGSGKSTFVDHLIEVALPKELLKSTLWCRINMNAAPVSPNEIYAWLRKEIIASTRASVPELDFDSLDGLRKVFSVEIDKFNRGVGKMFDRQSDAYKEKFAHLIEETIRDQSAMANAHVRFTAAEKGKLFIIVLDNCDKKTRDEQLLMFEAAQWLQKEFRCLVILPLRDETYDNHRDQPPLDTALKDLVFRIEPPLFQQVLVRRVQFALKKLGSVAGERLQFALPNGFRVEYPRSDQAFYLTSMLKSLFEHDRFARRMIVGLAGRNMRRALEIFLEFCNSGHIGEDQIFRMRQSEGNYTLALQQVATVLLRMNRRFYDSDHSYVKNLFAANRDDALPSYFSRLMILRWLRMTFQTAGTSGLRGYSPKQLVKRNLIPFGLSPETIDREIDYLLRSQCIVAEHLRIDHVDDDDLVRLAPAGFVHLDFVDNVHYLAAVAEDTFFDDRMLAERVAERMRNPDLHLHINNVAENAEELVSYLERRRAALLPPNGTFVDSSIVEQLASTTTAREALVRLSKSHSGDPWFGADKRLPRKSRHVGVVLNVVDFGSFIELQDGLVGLCHKSAYAGVNAGIGDEVEIEIQWVDSIRRKMNLKMLGIVQEDVGDTLEGPHTDSGQQSLNL